MLVVDDNSVNRRILARQIELAGASTDTAAGGEEALELLRRGPYDLVLADLQMPGMDGFELARRIRGREDDERLARTPILAVTASAFEDQEARSPRRRHGRADHQAGRRRAVARDAGCLAEGCPRGAGGVSAAYDRDRLVELFGDDPETLAEVEREFFETARDAAREIAATDDLATIARAAHRLKGASGMIGAAPLHRIAEAIERVAKADDLQAVRRMQEPFRREVLRVAEQAGLEHSV